MVGPNVTIGALQTGVSVSTFLFGIATLQTHTYMRKYQEDKLVVKLMVLLVWTLELAHTVAVYNGLYFMVISRYMYTFEARDDINELELDAGFRIAVLFSGCIASLVQAYFTHRYHILSSNLWGTLALYILAGVRFVGWISASTIGILGSYTSEEILAEIKASNLDSSLPGGKMVAAVDEINWRWGMPFVPLLAGGAVIDLVLAALVCGRFVKSKSISNSKLMDKLMFWTMQNGMFTGLAGILTVVCLVTMKDNYIWVAVFMILTRLFSNSFLASLNARQRLRKYRTASGSSADGILGVSPKMRDRGSYLCMILVCTFLSTFGQIRR